MSIKYKFINKYIDHMFFNEVYEKVLPYYEKNDPSHQIDHALKVSDTALEMARQEISNIDTDINIFNTVFVTGMLHDIKAHNREKHHEEAVNELLFGKLNIWFKKLCKEYNLPIKNILFAIYEHRASYEGEFSSIISEIISSADRNEPNIETWLKRAKYSGINDNINDAIDHVIKKMGRNGYARLPEIYKNFYKDKLEEFYNILDDRKKLIEIYHIC